MEPGRLPAVRRSLAASAIFYLGEAAGPTTQASGVTSAPAYDRYAQSFGRCVAARIKWGRGGTPLCAFQVGEADCELFLDQRYRTCLRVGSESP
jgi:hypothetical protein